MNFMNVSPFIFQVATTRWMSVHGGSCIYPIATGLRWHLQDKHNDSPAVLALKKATREDLSSIEATDAGDKDKEGTEEGLEVELAARDNIEKSPTEEFENYLCTKTTWAEQKNPCD